MPNNLSVRVRPATRDDIPALTTLMLTSFRQFPLIDRFYWPLRQNPDAARDTVWHWSRRFRAYMLDPSKRVMVAEAVDSDEVSRILASRQGGSETGDPIVRASWGMLSWSSRFWRTNEPALIQRGRATRKSPYYVVGFAFWFVRDPEPVEADSREIRIVEVPERKQTWLEWLEGKSLLMKSSRVILNEAGG